MKKFWWIGILAIGTLSWFVVAVMNFYRHDYLFLVVDVVLGLYLA